MSFTKEKQERIKLYIIEKINENDSDFVNKAVKNFDVSKNTIYRYVRDLRDRNIIKKNRRNYSLVSNSHTEFISVKESPDEFTMLNELVFPRITDLPANVRGIWEYGFTEMFNNVVEHSRADTAAVLIERNYLDTIIAIVDNGIGIFNNIKYTFGYSSIDDAIIELFKGKLTTDKDNHSGEGIFFTSKAMDTFAAFSDHKVFSHSEYDEIIDDIEGLDFKRGSETFKTGTMIYMKLANRSKKDIKDIFDRYSDIDEGFTKTTIPLRNIYSSYPVSRSQAKRLYNRLTSFKEVELDFSDISFIGQGYAHELFIVFHRKHPEVEILVSNANADVQRMINHVKNTKL